MNAIEILSFLFYIVSMLWLIVIPIQAAITLYKGIMGGDRDKDL